jgi:eukaryotic-like serine/threonine-protein kinase
VVGTQIAQYRVLERLGEGGMGEVYLVEDTRLQRRAALKLISPSLTRDETRRQRFIQEARLAASLDHPHIAGIHDVGEFDGRTFIVMEYVEGRSVREALQSGPLKLRQVIDYAVQAGEALAKVHEGGIVHRDLKPENLLIAKEGYLKVIDFGLAKLADPMARSGLGEAATVADGSVRTADGMVMGTVGYMSPEQVRGERVDARSDVFSFGAVLYEMVTGTAPFRKRSAAETISAILGESPAPPNVDDALASTELQRIIRKCLAKDPESRYQGMRDLVVDLRELRDTLGSSQATSRAAGAVRQPASTRPTRTILVGAAVLTVIALAAVAYVTRGTGSPGGATGERSTSGRPSMAVVPFEVMGGTDEFAWLGKGLPSMLITGLAQTPDIELIGNDRLSDAARQVGAASLDAVDRSQLGDLARRSGARFVLNGTIVRAGGDLRIDARIEDLETGAVRLAETVRGSDALALADDLAARVRRGFDVRAEPGAVRRLADVSTASIEAYRAYIAGQEAERNLRLDDASRLFQEAVALDPGFGLAYFHLYTSADFAGRVRASREWLQQAAAHVERMPERDAQLVRAEQARLAGRTEESMRLLEDVVNRYPETEMAWLRLGLQAFLFDPQRAHDAFARGAAALPQSPGLLNMQGYGQLLSGRIEQALRSFEGYVKLRPSEANALDSLAEGYLVAGDPAKALATFEAAVKGGYRGGGQAGMALALAVLGRYDEALADPPLAGGTVRALLLSRVGRYREAEELSGRVARNFESSGWTEGVAWIHLVNATYDLERGRWQDGLRDVAAAEGVLASSPEGVAAPLRVYADLIAGVSDAREGRVDGAERRLAHARSIHRSTFPLDRWWLGVLEGEIALARGDHAAAARAFESGMPTGRLFFNRHLYFFMPSVLANNLVLRDGPARIAAAQGRTRDAVAMYRRLLASDPDQPWTAVLEPRYVLALAQLLEKSGDRDAARGEYQRFLDYWKQADRDLSELAAARAALKNLGQASTEPR